MIEPAARDFTAVVVAAGRGARFGPGPLKLFRDLGGRPVLERAVRAVAANPAVAGVVVVLPAAELEAGQGATVAGWPGVCAVVAGGETRDESVRCGVERAATPYVLVHDGARPRVSPQLVAAVIEATRRQGAAIPVLEVADTVKRVRGDRIEATLPREELGLAQTPQGARRDWLLAALERARARGARITDEAAALEADGRGVAVVRGERSNLKVTTPADLAELARGFEPEPCGLRVGIGYDVHRFATGRRLVLGGVWFEGEVGLAGHSDADVVLHAALDALLGAAGLGDIGIHFPPDDPRFEGVASTELARRVRGLLDRAQVRIVNLDLTVLAERPRIAPRAAAMREAIAASLAIEPAQVGLKATTLEGLGALGRREGIACHAVALVGRGAADTTP